MTSGDGALLSKDTRKRVRQENSSRGAGTTALVPEDERRSEDAASEGFLSPVPATSSFALLSPPHLGPPLGTLLYLAPRRHCGCGDGLLHVLWAGGALPCASVSSPVIGGRE